MPTFNASLFLREAIGSILTQKYENWECLIVDDGSADDTVSIIHEFCVKDQRIKFFERIRNPKGANTCRNIGLENSKGRYVIYFDADDLLLPYCLEQRVEMMEQKHEDDFGVFHQKSFTNTIENSNLYTQLYKKNILYCVLATDNIWQTMGALWKKEFLVRIGGFDENIQIFDDDVLHLRALMDQNVKYSFYPDLPFDCYYRDCHRELDPDYCFVVYKNLDKYIKDIIHEYYEIIPDKKLLTISMNVAFTKLFIYFLWSQSKETPLIRNTIDLLSNKKLFRKKDLHYFNDLLSKCENKHYENREKTEAIITLLWSRFNREKSFIQNSPLKRIVRKLKGLLIKTLRKFQLK